MTVIPERVVADAIRDGAARDAEQRGTGRHRAKVLSTDPLRMDVYGLDLTLEPADLTTTRMTSPLAEGDVVVVIEVDENEWSVLGVEATDDDPEPVDPASQEDLDALTDRVAAIEPGALTYVSSFANSWGNADTGSPPPTGTARNAAYRHVGDEVELEGTIKGGTAGQAAFTLPVGARPPVDRVFAVFASSQNAIISVMASGQVAPFNVGSSNVSTFVFLDGVRFRVA